LSGGHAVYVQPRGAGEWLFDCGNPSALDFVVKPFLQAQGVDWLENFLLTHGDARQIGGAGRLQEIFPIRRAWASPVSSRSPGYREALDELDVKARLCRCITNGAEFPPWKFLHPAPTDRLSAADDNAVVALGAFDGVTVLLASDLGKAGQSAVLSRYPNLRPTIVIGGLPTRGEPLADEWLRALQPKLIVIVDSDTPVTRRAPRELERRLRRNGATVLFTRETGAVTFAIRDGNWRVSTARPTDAMN
jgi:competence protein ComEC